MKIFPMSLIAGAVAGSMCLSGTVLAQELEAPEPMAQVQTQGQLIHIMQVINQREIAEAELALNHTEHEDVQAYAQQLITDHESSDRRIEELERSGVTPESGELAEQLAMESGERMEEMSARTDAHLDCVFLSNQVALHQAGIELLSHELQPKVEDENVQEFVDLTLADFERHLAAGQMLLEGSICGEEVTQ